MEILKAVILAAGKGTRMNSNLPKVVHKIMDVPIINYVIKSAKQANVDDVCVIIGYKGDIVKNNIDEMVRFAVQNEQLGTGHAVKCAKDFIGEEGDTIVLCGDTPLIKASSLQKLIKEHKNNSNGVTVLSANIKNPHGYGRIIRDASGEFLEIIEEKDTNTEQKLITEINSGIYIFKSEALSLSLEMLDNDNSQKEYYLTDTIALVKKVGLKVQCVSIEDSQEILGINTIPQLEEAEKIMRGRMIF